MGSETVIFTQDERASLCSDPGCEEHGEGSTRCLLPHTKQDAIDIARQEEREAANTFSLKEHAEPKTATGVVEYADDR